MACHNSLVTPSGEDVSIGADWRASMMANAARDPYLQAAVRREIMVHPSAAAAIENECSACHMPMARFSAKAAGGFGAVFTHLPVTRQNGPQDLLAADGVSCALCHQIGKAHLGEDASFNAGFEIDTTTPAGRRVVFGPFDVDPGRTRLMGSASRFLPSQSPHIQRSEVCATCHTLITHALNEAGEVVGELPEQVPYLEWRHSAYADRQSCQDCHIPTIDGEMVISSVMGVPRNNVSRHVFRGGNFFMQKILNSDRLELGVAALPQELAATSQRTAEHLESAAARLALTPPAVTDGILTTDVVVTNLAGHKLPTAYPSRRAWLHLTVHDRNGELIFESGRFNADGSIEGNDNDADPSAYEPHHTEISRPEQVQIYEAIMADGDGSVTTVLLSAVRHLSDNRLLPDGFDKSTADADVATHGDAAADPDFVAERDTVRLRIDVGHAGGPFLVDAELWYQPVAYRWAHNLRQQQAPEIDRFTAQYDAHADASAVTLARAVARSR